MIGAGGAGSAGRHARPRAVADRHWSDSSRVFFLRFDGGDGGDGGDCDSTTVTTVCAVISTTVSIGLGPGPGRGAGPASRRAARDPRGDLDPAAEALRAFALTVNYCHALWQPVFAFHGIDSTAPGYDDSKRAEVARSADDYLAHLARYY